MNDLTLKCQWMLLIGCVLAACSPAGADSDDPTTVVSDDASDADLKGLQNLEHDLGIGSDGSEVRSVHAYLKEFGYFPNEKLAREYAAWRPIVDRAPADVEVYDESTEEAVRALQRTFGVDETGLIDEDTRVQLKRPRCGVPEGIQELDPTDKFILFGGSWTNPSLTWRVANTNDISLPEARAAAAAAFAQWAGPTRYSFTQRTTQVADIEIWFSDTDHDGEAWPPPEDNIWARARFPDRGGDIRLNNFMTWDTYQAQRILVHEIGHALGFGHTLQAGSVMHPQAGGLTLGADDHVAGLAKWIDPWVMFDGVSRDIDVDEIGGVRTVFVTAEPVTQDGNLTVWQLQNGAWSILGGQGAHRIASKNGHTFIAQFDGDIFKRVGGSWVPLAGCATDLAVGDDGLGAGGVSVWRIGCTVTSGGFKIGKWNGLGWQETSGGAVRVSVGPRFPGGPVVPWIVQSDGDIYRRSVDSATSGSWGDKLPDIASNNCPAILAAAMAPHTAKDIAVSQQGYAWIVSLNDEIRVWAEQAAVDDDGGPACRFYTVPNVPGGGRNIAVDNNSNPFVVSKTSGAFAPFAL